MNQAKLAQRLRQREQRVYEELIEEYGRLLWTIAAGILSGKGSREDVEEVVFDVFVELWEKPEQFDPSRGELKTLLCVKVRTRAIDRLRKLCRVELVPLEEADAAASEDLLEQLLSRMTLRQALRCLDALGEPDREILRLRLLYNVKPADIAAKLSLPVQSIYERLRRGKARLAKQLQQEGIQYE